MITRLLLQVLLLAAAVLATAAQQKAERVVSGNNDVEAYAQPVCGYITGNALLPLECDSTQACHGSGNWLGCCNTAISFSSLVPTTWTATVTTVDARLTTETAIRSNTLTELFWSMADCLYVTTCYPYYKLTATPNICTGACASNPSNLLCADPSWPICMTLTSSPGLTALTCGPPQAGNLGTTALPLLLNAEYIYLTSSTTTTTASSSSSFSPTQFIPTGKTQPSRPASATNAQTLATTSTSEAASSCPGNRVNVFLLTLFSVFIHCGLA